MTATFNALRETSRWRKAAGVIGLAVLFWVARDLTDVITSDGSPGTSPNAPAGQQHDPSQFDH